ncbi:MAG: hypothetical protein K2G30_08140 [Muribaculaceae bacterium]|nr:hypothetical protein [Muribaculaceae bacterium]MDE7142950.1 hypothetical protein [Muribaculaceae bacterium]
MNHTLEGILYWPCRARHACGFGLHSPYAFSTVTGVLRDDSSGYYAYGELRGIASRHGRAWREARAVYRLLLHLRSVAGDAFRTVGPSSGFISEIASLAFPDGADAAPAVCVADTFSGDPEKAAAMLREVLGNAPSAILLTGIDRSRSARELRRMLLAERPAGMAFDGWHSLMIVARRGLPPQSFKVLFPR